MPKRLLLATWLLTGAAVAQTRIALDGTWQLALDDGKGSPTAFDRDVVVPAAFETALGVTFDGAAWYRRALPLAAGWRGAAVRIEFAAVATHARVRCNGRECGEHLGGWTPFRVDVTAALRWDGNDVVEVRVDELPGHDTQGFLPVIQPHFGGIWQPVTMCIDRDAVLDRPSSFAFGRANADGSARLIGAIRVLDRAPATAHDGLFVRAAICDGERTIATVDGAVGADGTAPLDAELAAVRAWSPASPHRYRLQLELRRGDTVLDRDERHVAFRSMVAEGSTILWNGRPLSVRGVLHWGYSPPHLAPPCDPAFWRRQLEDFRSLGFNLLKCCLWVPPPCVYELCDELGMLVWQEYPTWHAHIDQAHRQALLDEYAGFFAHDRAHAAVAFRSLTCETGHGADLEVVQALFAACHAAVPDTLVVDDSSWLGWQRVTDFWDEHPYGNDRWWPGRLAEFQRFVAEHGVKPLLLGECIAADTWVDRAEWQRRHGGELPWWLPDCLADQARFEDWVGREFGADTLASLGPIARDAALRTRRFQIERLRRTIPTAGYVVSVARDFGKARMGLYDDFDRLKWQPADWRFQRDTVLCLDTDARAFVVGREPVRLGVCRVDGAPPPPARGPTVSAPVLLPPLPSVDRPARHRVTAAIGDADASWDVWLLPPFVPAVPPTVRVADHLDADMLTWVEGGGRVLLRVGGAANSAASEGLWYLRGAAFAPPHPVHTALPLAMLLELQTLDLDGGRVMPWAPWLDQVDPILAFWETHDQAAVRAHLFCFDTMVGKGRLLASVFDRTTPAGCYVEQQLLRHLADGPPARRALRPETIAALHGMLTARELRLPVWRFRIDPDDVGSKQGFWQPDCDDAAAPWRDLRAGTHWENQAEDLQQYTGVAWYRHAIDLPADWPDDDVTAVFEGVDDSFEFWLDGRSLGRRGDPATGVSVWLEEQRLALGRLQPGRHSLCLRVVDHGGAGGIWKPAYLTTGPTGPLRRLLQ